MTYIKQGHGFKVGVNFARAWADLPIELAPHEYIDQGFLVGYITGKPDSEYWWLRHERVRVYVNKSVLGEQDQPATKGE